MISKKCERCGETFTVGNSNEKRKLCWTCKPHRFLCLGCGRSSHTLVDGLCSFCVENKRAQIMRQREEEKNPTKPRACSKCGSYITKNENRLYNGLCPSCYFQQTKVKA
jgi:NMD protein affecting ribosome stability and mRNA decay